MAEQGSKPKAGKERAIIFPHFGLGWLFGPRRHSGPYFGAGIGVGFPVFAAKDRRHINITRKTSITRGGGGYRPMPKRRSAGRSRKRTPKRDNPEIIALGIMAAPFILAWEAGKAVWSAGNATRKVVGKGIGSLIVAPIAAAGRGYKNWAKNRGNHKFGRPNNARPRNRDGTFAPMAMRLMSEPTLQQRMAALNGVGANAPRNRIGMARVGGAK